MPSAAKPLTWNEPGCINLSEIRDVLQTEVLPAVEAATLAVWREEVPVRYHGQITRQLRTGIRDGFLQLRRAPETEHECWYVLHCLPSYWEPPVPDVPEEGLPPYQARAYRWAVALLAYSVRNALEDLHAKFTSDARMPLLNRGIRNALYSSLLRNPAVIWRLSQLTRSLISLVEAGEDIRVPAAAG